MSYEYGSYLPHVLFGLLLLFLIWRIGNELGEIAHRFLRPLPVYPPSLEF